MSPDRSCRHLQTKYEFAEGHVLQGDQGEEFQQAGEEGAKGGHFFTTRARSFTKEGNGRELLK